MLVCMNVASLILGQQNSIEFLLPEAVEAKVRVDKLMKDLRA